MSPAAAIVTPRCGLSGALGSLDEREGVGEGGETPLQATTKRSDAIARTARLICPDSIEAADRGSLRWRIGGSLRPQIRPVKEKP